MSIDTMTAEAAAKFKYETQLLNQAQAKGIALTPTQRAELMALADTMGTVESATAAVKEQAKKAREALDFAKETTGEFMSDFRSNMENGQGFWKSFSNAALNAMDKIIEKIQGDFLDSILSVNKAGASGSGGGLFGGLASLFGGGGDLFGGVSLGTTDAILGGAVGMFAGGTNYAPGGPAIVGEKGPELVNLPRGSQVIPNHALPRMQAPANSSAAPSISIGGSSVVIQGDANEGTIARVEAMLKARDKSMSAQVVAAYTDA